MSDVAATATLTSPSAQQAAQSSGPARPLDVVAWRFLVQGFARHRQPAATPAGRRFGLSLPDRRRALGRARALSATGFTAARSASALASPRPLSSPIPAARTWASRCSPRCSASRDHDSDPTVGTAPVAHLPRASPYRRQSRNGWLPRRDTGRSTSHACRSAPHAHMAGAADVAGYTRAPLSLWPLRATRIPPVSAPPRTATPAAPRPNLCAQPPSPQPPARQSRANCLFNRLPMNRLFRSPPAGAPATPEQAFLTQNSQFQRQISQGRGSNGAVLNDHPVPLELSSNLLPVMPAGGHLSLGAGAPPRPPQPGRPLAPLKREPGRSGLGGRARSERRSPRR